MRLSITKKVILVSMIVLINHTLFASVDFTIYPNGTLLGPAMDFADITDTENEIKEHPEKIINNNDKVIPYGMALANTIGYPNGKSIIPNFEVGAAVGGAVYQLDRYDKDKGFSKDDPKIPGAGVNAAVHFGLGLSKETDITFKMLFNKGIYSPEKELTNKSDNREYKFELDKADFVSLGIKGRYNLVSEVEFIPFVFSFGGVTAGVAVDYLHGNVSTTGSYKDIRNVDFEGSDVFSGDTFTQSISIETNVSGEAAFEWNMISVTPEIMTYIDLLYLFSIYTGPAVSLNAGSANLSMSADGAMKNLTSVYADDLHTVEIAAAGNNVATGSLRANVPLSVPVAIPLWKVGLELNFWAIKVQAEGAAVLTDPTKSFTAQVGVRVQF